MGAPAEDSLTDPLPARRVFAPIFGVAGQNPGHMMGAQACHHVARKEDALAFRQREARIGAVHGRCRPMGSPEQRWHCQQPAAIERIDVASRRRKKAALTATCSWPAKAICRCSRRGVQR